MKMSITVWFILSVEGRVTMELDQQSVANNCNSINLNSDNLLYLSISSKYLSLYNRGKLVYLSAS